MYKSSFLVFWGNVCTYKYCIEFIIQVCFYLFSTVPPECLQRCAGRRVGSTELCLSSDLTYFAVRHPSLRPPWQFSLGCEFNIVQNRICIYISFFIRSGQLWKPCLFLSEIRCNQFSGKLYLVLEKKDSNLGAYVKMYVDLWLLSLIFVAQFLSGIFF